MTENARKIFDMLGVELNERFKLDNSKYCYTYYIDENLIVRIDKTNNPSICNVLDIIREDIKIIKIPKYEFTKEEKKILRCFKQIGYNYIARDEDGELALYSNKPYKKTTMWNYHDGEYIDLRIKMFESIKWEDSEPFEIPDIENEPEYETDKEKIKNKLKSISTICQTKCDKLDCCECKFFASGDCNYDMFIEMIIDNGFTFSKNTKEKSEFPIEKFQDSKGSISKK